ncbi:MAG: hypothetical protein J0H80_24060, partial [Rhizobiales bacterium]|nr:hypothetical protein [Hyphomicrobiales bacterium]
MRGKNKAPDSGPFFQLAGRLVRLEAVLEQRIADRRGDSDVFQRNQHLGVGAAIGQPDIARSLLVQGLDRGLDLVGTLTQVFGLLGQQVAARIDADIGQLGCLL